MKPTEIKTQSDQFYGKFAEIASAVKNERIRQNLKFTHSSFGAQYHNIFVWLAVLGEEKGECDKAGLEIKFGKDTIAHLREELIQTAAVSFAIIERIDANEGELFA